MANLSNISTETLEEALELYCRRLMNYLSPAVLERTHARIDEIEAELYKRNPNYR